MFGHLSTMFRRRPAFAASSVHAIARPRSAVHCRAIAVQLSALGAVALLRGANAFAYIACLRFAVACPRYAVAELCLAVQSVLCRCNQR